jgi:hypothetical protein
MDNIKTIGLITYIIIILSAFFLAMYFGTDHIKLLNTQNTTNTLNTTNITIDVCPQSICTETALNNYCEPTNKSLTEALYRITLLEQNLSQLSNNKELVRLSYELERSRNKILSLKNQTNSIKNLINITIQALENFTINKTNKVRINKINSTSREAYKRLEQLYYS